MNQYITPSEVLSLAGQVVNDDQCKAATSVVEQNEIFYVETNGDVTLRDIYTDEVDLGDYPITSIAEVSIDGTVVDIAGNIEILDQKFYPGKIFYKSGFSAQRLRIKYKYGYATIPQTIKMACAQIACLLPQIALNIESESEGGYKVTFNTDRRGEIQKILDSLPRKITL